MKRKDRQMISVPGKLIDGNIWISSTNIQIILYKDLNETSDKTVKNYILNFIERLEKMKKT